MLYIFVVVVFFPQQTLFLFLFSWHYGTARNLYSGLWLRTEIAAITWGLGLLSLFAVSFPKLTGGIVSDSDPRDGRSQFNCPVHPHESSCESPTALGFLQSQQGFHSLMHLPTTKGFLAASVIVSYLNFISFLLIAVSFLSGVSTLPRLEASCFAKSLAYYFLTPFSSCFPAITAAALPNPACYLIFPVIRWLKMKALFKLDSSIAPHNRESSLRPG